MNQSPYYQKNPSQWAEITQSLIAEHPLTINMIENVTLSCWDAMWKTKIGTGETSISLKDLDPPATVIGYFFEKLFVYQLQKLSPNLWRGSLTKEDKDLVYIPNPELSIEIKTSGQLGTKIFGNRSYGKAAKNQSLVKKEKSGYYLTVNFYQTQLTLIRFGWIDYEDWQSQTSESGQMAGLSDEVYQHKLFTIYGDYLFNSSLFLLQGVGEKRLENYAQQEIKTLADLENLINSDKFTNKLKNQVNQLKNLFPDDSSLSYCYQDDLLKQVFWFAKLN